MEGFHETRHGFASSDNRSAAVPGSIEQSAARAGQTGRRSPTWTTIGAPNMPLVRLALQGDRPRVFLVDGACRIPLLEKDGRYFIEGTLDGIPTQFIVDTGGDRTVLHNRAVQKALKPMASLDGETSVVSTDDGMALQMVQTHRLRLRKLRIGGLIWENPVVGENLPDSRSESNFLGLDFLRRFRVLIDFPGHVLYLTSDLFL
jgi:hypothetical protein